MKNELNFLFDNSKINKNKIKREWIEKNNPEVFKSLSEFEKTLNIEIDKYSQLIYHYNIDTTEYPICDHCKGQNKRFVGFETGYKLGCSRHCAILLTRPDSNETRRINTLVKHGVEHTTQLKSVQDKMKSTSFIRFGVEHPLQNQVIKDKLANTNIERYGSISPLGNKEIHDKMLISVMEKWGVDNPIKSQIVKDKIKKNNLIKYGVEWHITSDKVRNKINDSQYTYNLNNIISKYSDIPNLILVSYENNIIKFHCSICNSNFDINSSLLNQRYIKNKIQVCLNCNPLNNPISNGHNEILIYLNEIGINNIVINNRKLISPYEIDIYLPDYKLAIEYNGVYWHSELYKDKNYHIMKNKMCTKEGIEIIQIWEDDWLYKTDRVKSLIKNRVGKNEVIIGSRKCVIRNVSGKDSKTFLNNNHIQGWSISKYRYGLYYKDELVSLATFSNGRKNMNGDINTHELVRFCNKINTNVIGSLSRLFKHFIKEINPNTILSYCDNDLFSGSVYYKLGMGLEKDYIPNYYWSDGFIRYNRWNFRKDKLVSEGFDPKLSETDIMHNRGWHRCYGTGNKRFIWNRM
jgi:very-short-patch-repair endonuclease